MAREDAKPIEPRRQDVVEEVARAAAKWRIGQWMSSSHRKDPTSVFSADMTQDLEEHLVANLGEAVVDRFLENLMWTEAHFGTDAMFSEWRSAYKAAACSWLERRADLPEYRAILGPLQQLRLKMEFKEDKVFLLELERTLFPRRRKAKG